MPVRIPKTASRRDARDFCRVLSRVSANARSGFEFEGSFLRPGALVPDEQLFLPGADPEFAIVLECAGPDRSGGLPRRSCDDHRQYPLLWILWRYDRKPALWRELARASAADRSWLIDIGPIARRALQVPLPPRSGSRPAAAAVSARLLWLSELERLDGAELDEEINTVYHELAWRIASRASQ